MMTTLREVRLYGALGRQFGRVHHLAVESAAEAARALCAVLPGFKAAFLSDDGRQAYHVYVGRGARREVILEDQGTDPLGAGAPIRFVPMVAGSKRAGLGQILLGAALIGLTIWNPLGAFAGQWAPFAFTGAIGKALILGGVIQLLSPQRKASGPVENKPSYGMDAGALNNPDPSAAVPLAYGRIVIGSVVVSAGLSTDEYGNPPFTSGGLSPQPLPDYMPVYEVDAGAGYIQTGDRGG